MLEQKLDRRRATSAMAALAVGLSVGLVAIPVAQHAYASTTCVVGSPGAAPVAVPITAAPGTAAWATEYAAFIRTSEGLGAGTDAIQGAMQDPNSTDDWLGTPITADERAKLVAQDTVSRTVQTATNLAVSLDLKDVLSIFVDPADRALIDVSVSDDNCAVLSSLAPVFPALKFAAVHVPGAVSSAASDDALQTLNRNLGALADQGAIVDAAWVDSISGRLKVRLDKSSPTSALKAVVDLIGDQGIDVTLDGVPAEGASVSRMDPPNSPSLAGEDITDQQTGDYCTSNFDTSNGTYVYQITAAHCFRSSDDHISLNGSTSFRNYYTDTKAIGTPKPPMLTNNEGANGGLNCDCEAIGPAGAGRDTSSDAIVQGDPGTRRTYSKVAYNQNDFEYSPAVCLSGVAEANYYGDVICGTIQNANMTVRACLNNCTFSWTVTGEFSVNFDNGATPMQGDSGGPGGHGGDTLFGILSSISGSMGYFSKACNIGSLYPAMNWIGMSHV